MVPDDKKWDIDYHVTFPSCDSLNGVRQYGQTDRRKEPVIILLGWAGCKDRNLEKYSAIYEKRCVTIRYTAPEKDIFLKSNNLRQSARKLLELLIDLDLQSNPIFVHSFSNGGGLVYRWISEIIHCDAKFQQIRLSGVIFDSCPGKRNLFRGAKVFMMTMNHHSIIKYIIAITFVFYWIAKYIVRSVIAAIFPSLIEPLYWEAMMLDPSTCPQLFLYSKSDDLIPYTDVEEQIAARKRRGINVQSVCWPDSKHVAHLLKYRESYIKLCLDFVECGERCVELL